MEIRYSALYCPKSPYSSGVLLVDDKNSKPFVPNISSSISHNPYHSVGHGLHQIVCAISNVSIHLSEVELSTILLIVSELMGVGQRIDGIRGQILSLFKGKGHEEVDSKKDLKKAEKYNKKMAKLAEKSQEDNKLLSLEAMRRDDKELAGLVYTWLFSVSPSSSINRGHSGSDIFGQNVHFDHTIYLCPDCLLPTRAVMAQIKRGEKNGTGVVDKLGNFSIKNDKNALDGVNHQAVCTCPITEDRLHSHHTEAAPPTHHLREQFINLLLNDPLSVTVLTTANKITEGLEFGKHDKFDKNDKNCAAGLTNSKKKIKFE